MTIKSEIKKLEATEHFKEFKKKNQNYHLAHIFILKEKEKEEWQIGYYLKKEDKVAVFELGDEIIARPAEEVFKKSGTIHELDMNKIKVSLEKALKATEDIKNEKCPAETITKKIIILQKLKLEEEWKNVFNITYVTQCFNILNVKLDAETGDVKSVDFSSILNLGKPD